LTERGGAALPKKSIISDEALIERRALIVVLILAAAVRLAFAAILPDQSASFPDVASYRDAAREILSGHLISSDLAMPGYILFLAATGATTIGRILADIAASVVSVWCVARITRTIGGDVYAGLMAALIWAFYPFSIFYAVVGSSETLFTTLLLLAFFAYYRASFVLGSVAMGAAILTRPHVAILAPILVLVFSQLGGRLEVGRTIRNIAILAICTVMLMAPWWWHNFEKYRTFVPLNLGGGVALYAGNNPMNQSGGGIGDVDYDQSAFSDISDPAARDRALKAAATRYIIEDPLRFASLAWQKFCRLWRPWPYANQYSGGIIAAIVAASFAPILLLAIAGAIVGWRRDYRAVLPILLFIAYTTAVHMVTIASLRYRFPMEPFLVVLAAPVIADVGRWLVKRIRPSAPTLARR
jgi:4-amino-4-deoxy-L-arabinose transferase-like glycosyltransferase